ncbi:MAG: FlgD immunoglobulin-like domain containing protein [Armatimonadota bacterium]
MRHAHGRMPGAPRGGSRGPRQPALVLLLCIAAGALRAVPAQGARPFRNVVNIPFETVSTGPQGAVVVPLDGFSARHPRLRERALWRAIRSQHDPRRLMGAARLVQRLRAARGLPTRYQPRFPRLVVFAQNNRPAVLSNAGVRAAGVGARALGGGTLTLNYPSGSFDGPGEQAALNSLFAAATPQINALYDPPAETTQIDVEETPGLLTIQGGLYIPGTPTARLLLPPFDPEVAPADDLPNLFTFLQLLVRAYHNTAFLFFDAWEEGFAQVVALDVMAVLYPTVDPIFYAVIVPIPWHDLMNRPGLNGPSFYPASGYSGMLPWRYAASTAVWGKCFAQDTLFFKKFNQAYYAAFSPSLPGDVPALRSLAAGIMPTIEGLDFSTWFHLHHVLDNSISFGPKAYTFPSLFPEGDQPDEYTVALAFAYYNVNASGDEVPLGGTADILYWDHDRSPPDIDAGVGANQAVIPATGADAGTGFAAPTFFPQNVGNQGQEGNGGRIFIDIALGGAFYTLFYPYTGPGPDPGPSTPFQNDFYGVLTGADDGEVVVTPPVGSPVTLQVDEGEFHGHVAAAGFPPQGQYRVEFFNPAGALQPNLTRLVNVYGPQYCVLLEAENAVGSIQANLPAGLSLMSLPILAMANGQIPADPADVLGIAQNRLVLGRWDPDALGDDKYRFYPQVPPFAPGLGYFLRLTTAITGHTIPGVVPPNSADYRVPVLGGWNMVGFPFNHGSSILVTDLEVGEGDDVPVPWNTAASNGLVEGGVFDFEEGRTPETDTVSSLSRFKGYWMRCLNPDGCQIYFPGPTAPAGVGALAARPDRRRRMPPRQRQGEWQLSILAQAGPRSGIARLGVNAAASDGYDPAFDFHRPPELTPSAAVYFPHDDWGANSGYFARDVRPADGARRTWDFEVFVNAPNMEVTLTWPDIAELPRGLRPMLIDHDSGQRRHMRVARSYTYNTGTTGQRRHFSVVARSGLQGLLSITNITQSSQRGGPVSVHFNLSLDAATSVRVRNIAGRLVRVVQQKQPTAAGVNTVVWDLRSSWQTRVPPGTYLCEIEARSEDGQYAKGLRTLLVTR